MSLILELVAQTLISQSHSDDTFKDSGQPSLPYSFLLLLIPQNPSLETPLSSKKMNPQLPLNCEQARIECSINHVLAESQEKIESFQLIEIKAWDLESFGGFTVQEKQEMTCSVVEVEESFQIFELKAENQVKFDNFDGLTVVEKQEIPPSSTTENSSVEQTQVLDNSLMAKNDIEPSKKPSLQETPSTDTSDKQNSSQENPSNTLVQPTAYRAKDWVYDIIGDQQNDPLEHERVGLLKQNSDLKASMGSLAMLYDTARSNYKKADVDKEKMLQRIKHGENFKFLLDPNRIKNENYSLSEENKIWRENRVALDANLKELISMLKIASAPDTPDRYGTSTLGLGEQTIAEKLKPYAAELEVITKAFRDKFESHMGILTGNIRALDANIKKLIMMINAETMAEELEAITNSIRSKQSETQKNKSFWVWLSAAITVVAAASMAFVAR